MLQSIFQREGTKSERIVAQCRPLKNALVDEAVRFASYLTIFVPSDGICLNATVFDRALSAFTVCVRNFSSFNSAALRNPSCPFCSIRFFLPSAFSRVGKRAKALWADPRPAAGSAISESGRSGERRRFMVSHPRRFPDARSGK